MSGPFELVQLTNCRLCISGQLVPGDLWISPSTGCIVDPPKDAAAIPHKTHNLGGRILAPGLIEVQINGGFGFDFSVPGPGYSSSVAEFNHRIIEHGVTSYLPTVTSQAASVYQQVRCAHTNSPPRGLLNVHHRSNLQLASSARTSSTAAHS